MNYKELQQRAKELGLPYGGVPQEKLELAIQEAEKVLSESASGLTDEAASSSKPESKSKSKVEAFNTAVVLNGKQEVRRYTKREHGEDFEANANDFASKRGYEVQLETVEAGIVCPHCGRSFNRKKAA